MRLTSLKSRLFVSFVTIVLTLGVSIFLLGYYVISIDIVGRAKKQVLTNLKGAHTAYLAEITRIGEALRIGDPGGDIEMLRQKMNLDYLFRVTAEEALTLPNRIVREVLEKGEGIGATRLIAKDELARMNPAVRARANITILDTPMARPTTMTVLDTGMAKEYAIPIPDSAGRISGVLYGGRIINQDYALVDRIKSIVFGQEIYNSKPVGTVTIFQDDVRISTNVLTREGHRAIGTRISEQVYQCVVEEGRTWQDRAFVVTDWCHTAYEPVRDIEGKIVGILYVGVLERPFSDMARQILLVFILVLVLAAALGAVLSFILAGTISRPLTHMLEATRRISTGDLGHIITAEASIAELHDLARAFNEMSARLEEREMNLQVSKQKLEESNKSYLELIGFVAHELKGLLASAIMNAYAIRDGFLGMINFKQKKAIDSITRNLDYLTATVKKFLNLSRIERGNLDINRTKVRLKEDILDPSLETFSKIFLDKRMKIRNTIEAEFPVLVDADLMMIVANNLINNAAKYGFEDGQIRLSSTLQGGRVRVEVYNDGRPILEEAQKKLFRKFSRLDVPEKKTVKGSGLGLYITKQIVEAHGGRIWVEPAEKGNSFIFEFERGM